MRIAEGSQRPDTFRALLGPSGSALLLLTAILKQFLDVSIGVIRTFDNNCVRPVSLAQGSGLDFLFAQQGS